MDQKLITCSCDGCELRALFFENVPKDELENICSVKVERNFDKGDIIIGEGDAIDQFMYLKKGLVKIYRKADENRDQIIKFAPPLDFVSMLSVFSDSHYHYSVSAIEDSVVCYIDLNLVKYMALQNGKFALSLLRKMSWISDDIIKTTLDIRKKNLRGRIAYVLIYFSKTIYKSASFELPVSRKEIAEMIEMTTENVIRILSEFRKDGIIKIFGKTIEIVDMERLEKVNQFG
ncbi:MAG: Crp/Fnr family transcriptional regulator [Bacteroidales bacterium]|nr:Crp/Fnr family transcriptional regulator [Bacteroidales bacterium]